MSKHDFNRDDIDLAVLAKELTSRVGDGRKLALSAAFPADTAPGKPGVLVVIDDATGEQIEVDDQVVQQVVKAHVKPAPEPHRLDELADAVDSAVSVAELKAALGSYVEKERRAAGLKPRAGRIVR